MEEDLQLLQKWREGDKTAGNELFQRHFSALYTFFRNKTQLGIDDLVQRTFLACVEGRDRFREDSSFRTYMFAAARRILYREFEHRRRDGVDFGVSSVHDLDPTPSGIVVQKQEQRLLLAALRMIPLDHQVALELCYVQGLRGPQLARILEVPEGTVRSRLSRGIENLRKKVSELADSPTLLKSTISGLESWGVSLRGSLAPT